MHAATFAAAVMSVRQDVKLHDACREMRERSEVEVPVGILDELEPVAEKLRDSLQLNRRLLSRRGLTSMELVGLLR